MNDKTKEFIESHINRIINEFNFKKRKEKNPEECLCYQQDKPCHEIPKEEFNCFLCYCPEYDSIKSEGGCKLNSKKGKWFYHHDLPKGKIWDCSDCDYPHRIGTVKKYLKKFFGIKENDY